MGWPSPAGTRVAVADLGALGWHGAEAGSPSRDVNAPRELDLGSWSSSLWSLTLLLSSYRLWGEKTIFEGHLCARNRLFTRRLISPSHKPCEVNSSCILHMRKQGQSRTRVCVSLCEPKHVYSSSIPSSPSNDISFFPPPPIKGALDIPKEKGVSDANLSALHLPSSPPPQDRTESSRGRLQLRKRLRAW